MQKDILRPPCKLAAHCKQVCSNCYVPGLGHGRHVWDKDMLPRPSCVIHGDMIDE